MLYKVYRLRKHGLKLAPTEIAETEVLAILECGPHFRYSNIWCAMLYEPETRKLIGELHGSRTTVDDERGIMVVGYNGSRSPVPQAWWCVPVSNETNA